MLGMGFDVRTASGAYTPDAGELALLAFCNASRAQAGLAPLVWNDGLGQAARAHSTDMAKNGCYQHSSCNGTGWSTRIAKYYSPWTALGENIALGGSNPRDLHDDWMASPGHRANILGPFSEFGAGIALGQTNFGVWAYATEDFGNRGAITPATIPTLPSGGIAPRIGGAEPRELVVNYFHHNGAAPKSVRAMVGSSCVNLSKTAGSATNGTYGASRTFSGSGCVPVVFEAIRSDGVRIRWPADKAVLVGVGAGGFYCAETTTAVPTQDCGGGGTTPTPGPTPAPTPAPGDTSELKSLRVVAKPGKANTSAAVIQVQAVLPQLGTFDPSSGPITIRINLGRGADWGTTIPATCGATPCLKPNNKLTSYNGKVGKTTIGFVRAQNGKWKLRFSAKAQTLGSLDPGKVEVTLSVDGRTFTGSATGELKQSGLFAD